MLLVGSDQIRYGVYPTSADGAAAVGVTLTKNAAAWTWGVWAQVVLAAGVAAETQIVGFALENFVGVPAQGEIQIGTGVAPAGAVLATFNTAMGNMVLDSPIRIDAATGIVARYRNANAVADTVDIKISVKTGF